MAEEEKKATKQPGAVKKKNNDNTILFILRIGLLLILVMLISLILWLAKILNQKNGIELRMQAEKDVNMFLSMQRDDNEFVTDEYVLEFLRQEGIESLIVYSSDGDVVNVIKSTTPVIPSELSAPRSFLVRRDSGGLLEILSTIDFTKTDKYMQSYYRLVYYDNGYLRMASVIKSIRDISICACVAVYFFALWLYLNVIKLKLKLSRNDNLVAMGSASRRLAHEIKNPLTAIIMRVQLLKKIHPEIMDDLDDIEHEGKRVLSLTQRIREFMSNPVGEVKQINVIDFVTEEIKYFKPGIISLNVYMSEATAFVTFDETRLRSIIINTIQNAIDAQAEKPKCEVVININSAEQGRKIKIDIIDSGTGIKDKDKDKIFNPFFSTKNTGTGIGLAISKQFLIAQGGNIELKNRYDNNHNILGVVCTIMLNRNS